ncbi:MAG: YIP1 family protein [Ignavibacteria bacterium]|nr:YIP1 family protein [Ignavibacteria bacterium]
MDEQIQNQQPSEEISTQVEELTFTDKMVGVLTEPSKVFENVKLFGPKFTDWFFPLLILIVLVILSSYITTSNPEIKAELDHRTRQATEERLDKLVKEGKITQQQKEEQLEQIEKFTSGPAMRVIQYVSIVIFMFVFTFLLAAVYYLIWIFILKGEGSYNHALSVYGLSLFINMIEVILVAILSLLMVKLLNSFSIAAFIDLEKGTTLNYILSKINPFTFWWLYVLGVGLGKVYSVPKNKSLVTIFILWLIYVVIGKFIPFLSFGT